MAKLKAVRITIDRAEGPCALCTGPKTFRGSEVWIQARDYLHGQAHTFPANGGYDKHDFEIEWEDGRKYEGRLDCQSATKSDPDLDVALHVKRHLEFYAGLWCPSHMTKEQYEDYLNRMKVERSDAQAFLGHYQIGDRPSWAITR